MSSTPIEEDEEPVAVSGKKKRRNVFKCVVPGCTQTSLNPELSFFLLPHDANLKKIWLKAIGRRKDELKLYDRICSDHFPKSDIVTKLRNELLGIKSRGRLVKGAIPSLNLKLVPKKQTPAALRREKKYAEKNAKEEHERLVKEAFADAGYLYEKDGVVRIRPESPDGVQMVVDSDGLEGAGEAASASQSGSASKSIQITAGQDTVLTSPANTILIKDKPENELCFKTLFHAMVNQYVNEKNELTNQIKELIRQLTEVIGLKNETLLELRNERKATEKAVEEKQKMEQVLKSFLSERQIKLLRGNRKVQWARSEIDLALALRKISLRAFLFVRKNLKYPMPGLSTIKRYMKEDRESKEPPEPPVPESPVKVGGGEVPSSRLEVVLATDGLEEMFLNDTTITFEEISEIEIESEPTVNVITQPVESVSPVKRTVVLKPRVIKARNVVAEPVNQLTMLHENVQ